MASNDRYDGRPSGATPVHPGSSPECDVGPAPVVGEQGTPLIGSVNSPARADGLGEPSDLLTSQGLTRFLFQTTRALRRSVPESMEDLAWDAAVETARKVRSAPDNFPNMATVRGYARRVLINMAVRARSRVAGQRVGLEEIRDLAAPSIPDEVKDLAARLDTALEGLPEHLRRSVVAVKLLGFTAQELAEVEGVAAQTIFNRTSQAVQKLREVLRPDEPS